MDRFDVAMRPAQPRARAMRISVEAAHRQLVLSLWLVALVGAATALTATVGIFA